MFQPTFTYVNRTTRLSDGTTEWTELQLAQAREQLTDIQLEKLDQGQYLFLGPDTYSAVWVLDRETTLALLEDARQAEAEFESWIAGWDDNSGEWPAGMQ